MEYIKRNELLYKSKVEYGDYCVNHVKGCAHGCTYPCYALLVAKRSKGGCTYEEWVQQKIVSNALELLEKEIPKHKDKIKFVHLCFSTDPFMYGYDEIGALSYKIIKRFNRDNIKCTVLTKGLLPIELCELSKENEYGITLVTLSKKARMMLEPNAAPIKNRIKALHNLHKKGAYTWVSIEPYPTPNIVEQNLEDVLDAVSFVDKVVFGRLNYNRKVSEYKNHKIFYNEQVDKVIEFCKANGKEFYIKKKTKTP